MAVANQAAARLIPNIKLSPIIITLNGFQCNLFLLRDAINKNISHVRIILYGVKKHLVVGHTSHNTTNCH